MKAHPGFETEQQREALVLSVVYTEAEGWHEPRNAGRWRKSSSRIRSELERVLRYLEYYYGYYYYGSTHPDYRQPLPLDLFHLLTLRFPLISQPKPNEYRRAGGCTGDSVVRSYLCARYAVLRFHELRSTVPAFDRLPSEILERIVTFEAYAAILSSKPPLVVWPFSPTNQLQIDGVR